MNRREDRHHEATDVCLDNESVPIDSLIAGDIEAINARGVRTWVSCQGDALPSPYVYTAYVGFDTHSPWWPMIRDVARRAGFHIDDRGSVYSTPHDHYDAARYLLKTDTILAQNTIFRLFLHDIAADTLDLTGDRYHCKWSVHDCAVLENGACIDVPLIKAATRLMDVGSTISVLCHGDQYLPTNGNIVPACARWTLPRRGFSDLRETLRAIGFEVQGWGIYTRRAANRRDEGSILVSRERLIAMNRGFLQVFTDFEHDCVGSADEYKLFVTRQQRELKSEQRRVPH